VIRKVIPVIIWRAGTVLESFRKYVSHKLGKNDITELKKTAILDAGNCARTGESTDAKHRTFVMGNNTACIIYCNHNITLRVSYIVTTK